MHALVSTVHHLAGLGNDKRGERTGVVVTPRPARFQSRAVVQNRMDGRFPTYGVKGWRVAQPLVRNIEPDANIKSRLLVTNIHEILYLMHCIGRARRNGE